MSAAQSPLPAFREDMFEFGEKEVPRHSNRKPVHNGSFWGLQGVVAPHIEGSTVLATNITDRSTLILLSDARLNWLRQEFGMDVAGDEVQILIPREKVESLYSQGRAVEAEMGALITGGIDTDEIFQRAAAMPKSPAPSIVENMIKEGWGLKPVSLPAAESAGGIATTASGGGIIPVPVATAV